jgi:hypothetical protein
VCLWFRMLMFCVVTSDKKSSRAFLLRGFSLCFCVTSLVGKSENSRIGSPRLLVLVANFPVRLESRRETHMFHSHFHPTKILSWKIFRFSHRANSNFHSSKRKRLKMRISERFCVLLVSLFECFLLFFFRNTHQSD